MLSLEFWYSYEHVTAVSYLILSSFTSRREWIGIKGLGKCVRLRGPRASNYVVHGRDPWPHTTLKGVYHSYTQKTKGLKSWD